jgi:hypothetical protein
MATPGLSSYLSRWEHARSRGQEPSPEELCPDRPELAEPLRQAIEALRVLKALTAPAGATVSPAGEGDAAATPGPPPGPAGWPAGISPPGYELLHELGRGSMGVVYQARQVALGRVVALKVILAGGHAGEEERRRFLAEAEAIARVRHPGIVQVYDYGTHDGLPFFSLECCDGGSLADRLDGTPLPPREAARLVEQIARAVEAAHAVGVVHRDLKPANVLLQGPTVREGAGGGPTVREGATPGVAPRALPDGRALDVAPKITDFGLAKRTEGGGATQSGAVLGTPSYMAPEQAEGKKGVGPPADVYALGAILYECLTGRPPFKAATTFDTILQVISDEPVPPGRLNPGVPRDLETACLKCLAKEPSRRYASAEALADDLGRWQRGEPIMARPVGARERAAKWVRRNPAVSALAAAVAAVTLAGLGVTTGLYLHSSRLAEERGAALEEVERAKDAAEQERNAARQAEAKTAKALDETEAILVEGLLRPIGRKEDPVEPAELEALAKLAGLTSDTIRLRFLEAALSDPNTARRVALRADRVVTALVGASWERHRQIGEWFQRRLRQPGQPLEIRAACARHLAAMEIVDDEVIRGTADWFRSELGKWWQTGILERTGLFAVLEILPPEIARRHADEAAQVVLAEMTGNQDSGVAELAEVLAALSGLLGEVQAEASARAVLGAMPKVTHEFAIQRISQALASLAGRLSQEQAQEYADRGARMLLAAMDKTTGRFRPSSLGAAMAALADRLPEKQAREYADAAARAVLAEIARAGNGNRHAEWWAVSALGRKLSEKQAQETTRAVLAAMAKPTDDQSLNGMASALAAITEELAEKQALETLRALLAAMARTTDGRELQGRGLALTMIAGRLSEKQAQEAAPDLLAAMAKAANREWALLRAAGELANRLPAHRAQEYADRVARGLLAAMPGPGADDMAWFQTGLCRP